MKQLSRYLVLFSVATLLVCFPLQSASAQSGGYVGIWGGYTIGPDASWESGPYSFDLDIQETWALGLKLGYTPPQAKYFSVEFEYSYWAPDIDRSVLAQAGTDFVAVEGDATLHNFMFNFIGKYPEGRFHPYIGVGIGFSYADMSATATSRIGGVTRVASGSNDDTTVAYQFLAGVEFDITNNMAIDLGYRYFYTKPEFEGTEVEFTTSMITLGLNFKF